MPSRATLVWLFALVTATRLVSAQSATAGDLTGTVFDPSGAVVRSAAVELENLATGLHQVTETFAAGTFRFALLPPGEYKLTVTADGFNPAETRATAVLSGATQIKIALAVKTQSASIDVLAESTPLQSVSGDVQSILNSAAIQNLPNPGNDITFYAQLAPGAVMNTSGGYGNFSSFGLPATSNLFTLNGENDNDPFLNVNKTGATDLMLGANELAEVSVTTNGYSGRYGQLAGAAVDYGTKSGSNTYHGNAKYYWDGRILNANDFFNNANAVPRQFVNANQWAASFGGPIKKNKTFFFVNNEGLRLALPTQPTPVRLPSPQFQAATLSNLTLNGMAAEVPFYQQLFHAFNSATGLKQAAPVALSPNDVSGPGCGDLIVLPLGVPCVVGYSAAPNALAHDAQIAVRVDQTIGEHDRLYARYQTARGEAPAYTDPINPVFSATSVQPSDQAQLNWTHILGRSATNQFAAAGLYSNDPFQASNPAAANALLPYFFGTGDGSFSSLNATATFTPQGRRVIQYQLTDDVSYTLGAHTLKIGINYHRDLVHDYDFGANTAGELFFGSIDDIYNGVLGTYGLFQQNFPANLAQNIQIDQLGFYLEDDVRLSSKLNLTLSLRADHNAAPTCAANCFSSSIAPFDELNHDPSIPYNAAIATGGHQAYQASNSLLWEPRIGYAYQPFSNGKTVIRGGAGIFGDSFPLAVTDAFAENIPQFNSIAVQGIAGYASSAVAKGVSGSVFDIAGSANQALQSAFNSGGTLASISNANPLFVTPGLTAADKPIRLPRYFEWNLELQHQFPWEVNLSINYVGNRGTHEIIANSGLNAYCQACAASFTFPTAPADPRFSTVTQYQSAGASSYNGLVISARKTLSQNIQINANYTFSHSLDDISNGGLSSFGTNSIVAPIDPFNLRAYNWGNSDYDVRHYISASYVLSDIVRTGGFHRGAERLFGGWTLAGTVFYRTGFPFSVTDSFTNLANDGGSVFAYSTSSARPNCGAAAVYTNNTPCLSESQFHPVIDPVSGLMLGLGNQTRNQYRGPGYVNTDLSVSKSFTLGEKLKLSVGAQFFNLFNHPNFAPPVNDIENPLFGQIVNTVNVPTSILGSSLGGDSSPRLIQLQGRIVF